MLLEEAEHSKVGQPAILVYDNHIGLKTRGSSIICSEPCQRAAGAGKPCEGIPQTLVTSVFGRTFRNGETMPAQCT